MADPTVEELERMWEEFNSSPQPEVVQEVNTDIDSLNKLYEEFLTKENKENSKKAIENISSTLIEILVFDPEKQTTYLLNVSPDHDYIYSKCGLYYLDKKDALYFIGFNSITLLSKFSLQEVLNIFKSFKYVKHKKDLKKYYDEEVLINTTSSNDIPYNDILRHLLEQEKIYRTVNNEFFFSEQAYTHFGYTYNKESGYLVVKSIEENSIIKIVRKCLEEFYPETSDIIKLTFDSSTYDSVVIKYPIVNIKNSEGQEHVIQDLYVCIPFVLNNNRLTFLGKLYGFRGMLTEGEYCASYLHSHLPCSQNLFTPQKFCTGTGEINFILHNLNSNFDEMLFKGLLINIESYISWESIEGRPHIRFQSVFSRGSKINLSNNFIFSVSWSELWYLIQEEIKIKEFKIEIVNNKLLFSFNNIMEILTECLLSDEFKAKVTDLFEINLKEYLRFIISKDVLVNYDSITDTYYKTSTASTLSNDIERTSDFKFRGDTIKGIIKKELTESSNILKRCNPLLVKYVKNKLELRAQDHAEKYGRSEKIRKTLSNN